MNKLTDVLVAAINEVTNKEYNITQADAHWREQLNITSLQMVSILTTTCETVGIDLFSLSDRDLALMETVRDTINILSEKLNTESVSPA